MQNSLFLGAGGREETLKTKNNRKTVATRKGQAQTVYPCRCRLSTAERLSLNHSGQP